MKQYILRLCRECAEQIFGFHIERIAGDFEQRRCEFCKKKKMTLPYMVTPWRKEKK